MSRIYVPYTHTHNLFWKLYYWQMHIGIHGLGPRTKWAWSSASSWIDFFHLALGRESMLQGPCPREKRLSCLFPCSIHQTNLLWAEAWVRSKDKGTRVSSVFLRGPVFLLYGLSPPILINGTLSFYLCYLTSTKILSLSKYIHIIHSYSTSINYGFG